MNGSGMKRRSERPTATAVPLKMTARPAVTIVRDDRLLPRGLPRVLLAVAVDHEQRVVDRDPEPDQHHHVLEVRRELDDVREDPDDAERDGDREERRT